MSSLSWGLFFIAFSQFFAIMTLHFENIFLAIGFAERCGKGEGEMEKPQESEKPARPKNLALPGNPRYQPKSLQDILGYDNLYRPVLEVELAALEVLGEIGIIPAEDMKLLTPEIISQLLEINTTEVDAVERRVTKHDIRALVRIGQQILPPALARWLHIPLTSYDPLDTARILQFVRAHQQVVAPKANELALVLKDLVIKYARTLQIGRTHGQHALPITVGFWLATLLSRIMHNMKAMDYFAEELVGKISGAVGAYNAQEGLGILAKSSDTEDGRGSSFEDRVLGRLGLKRAIISTQILPPEPLAYYLFSATMLSASLAQLARDCRHLMRSEIAEIGEPFEAGQVGSSTMAQKRNPINFENVEGMWLRTKNEFGKVLDTLISEHQRDLTGSSVYRDFPIIIVNLVQQMETLLRKNDKDESFLSRMTVNTARCEENFHMSERLILAEPLYIALQMAGYPGDAHELVNRNLVPISQRENMLLIDAARKWASMGDFDLRTALANIPQDVMELLGCPRKYTGLAAQKALKIAEEAEAYAYA